MEDDVDPRRGPLEGPGIANISLGDLRAKLLERGVRPADERPHVVATGQQLFDDVLAEKSPGARDQRFQTDIPTA